MYDLISILFQHAPVTFSKSQRKDDVIFQQVHLLNDLPRSPRELNAFLGERESQRFTGLFRQGQKELGRAVRSG